MSPSGVGERLHALVHRDDSAKPPCGRRLPAAFEHAGRTVHVDVEGFDGFELASEMQFLAARWKTTSAPALIDSRWPDLEFGAVEFDSGRDLLRNAVGEGCRCLHAMPVPEQAVGEVCWPIEAGDARDDKTTFTKPSRGLSPNGCSRRSGRRSRTSSPWRATGRPGSMLRMGESFSSSAWSPYECATALFGLVDVQHLARTGPEQFGAGLPANDLAARASAAPDRDPYPRRGRRHRRE